MGLKVKKTVVRKKKNCTNSSAEVPASADPTVSAPNLENDESTYVMFDIEKVNMETSITPERTPVTSKDEIEEYVDDGIPADISINIFLIEKKTRVTFDDILTSLNDCNKDHLHQNSSSDDDFDDDVKNDVK